MPREFRDAARELLYGELPVPLSQWSDEQRAALLAGTNEYGEPLAIRYHRVEWSDQDISRSLREGKFTRGIGDEWTLTGVDQPLDRSQLIANLATYSIHETRGTVPSSGRFVLLVPTSAGDFVQLVSMLYPHPAAEDAARALWRELVGTDAVPAETATHIGPSIDMLGRLNLRFRRQGTMSLIFREPDQSAAHDAAMKACKGQSEADRARQILTGAMRSLDENWEYDAVDAGLKGDIVAITTSPGGRGKPGGLVTYNGLKLHPDKKVIFAWVRSVEELVELCERVAGQRRATGRVPVLVFTSSRNLIEQFADPTSTTLRDAREYLMLYQLSSREEYVFHPIGLPKVACRDFQLVPSRFTSAFSNRLQSLLRPLRDSIVAWRRDLDARGRIAWPMRATGTIKDEDRDKLFRAFRYLMVESASPKTLAALDEKSGVNVEEIQEILGRMKVSPQAKSAGYHDSERFGLFTTLDQTAEPQLPAFLHHLCNRLIVQKQEWSYELAEQEWFWGYEWEGAKPLDTYIQWMVLLCELGFAEETAAASRRNDKRYQLVTRSAIRGALQEAWNWLKDDYPAIVNTMKSVFGELKVTDYFAPLTASQPGSKTLAAKDQLQQAESSLNGLDIAETSWKDARSPAEQQAKFIDCARRRLDARQQVARVFSASGYRDLKHDDSIRALNFENNDRPLWERIGQANLFVDFALKSKQRIIDRVGSLSLELHDATEEIKGFPIQIFTRSLDKITNILDGSIGTTDPEGSTQRLQYTVPGTLGHSLKELKVGQATEKLGQLAEEVGVRLDTDSVSPLNEITGSIVQGFHDLVREFQRERQRLDDLDLRLKELQKELEQVPDDFTYPASIPSLDELLLRPGLAESALSESLAEEVDSLISEHEPSSRLGNFHPLMTAARDLLTEPKSFLGRLAGQVTTLENAATGYRQTLLESEELRSVEVAFGSLLQVQRQLPEKHLDMADLKRSGSLRAAKQLVTERCADWPVRGNQMLSATGVTFGEWRTLITELAARTKLSLAASRIQQLVDHGFLEVAYRLGGGA